MDGEAEDQLIMTEERDQTLMTPTAGPSRRRLIRLGRTNTYR